MKLLEITKELTLLHELIGEELTEDQQAQFDEISNALTAQLESKASNIVQYANSLTTDVKQIDEEIKRLQDLKKFKKKKAEELKDFLVYAMERSNQDEIRTPTMTIKLKKLPTKITVIDSTELNEKFLRVPKPKAPEPDKKALLDEYKKTDVVPAGCRIETDRHGLNIR